MPASLLQTGISEAQPELSPEAISESSQNKGLGGRPEPLYVKLDR